MAAGNTEDTRIHVLGDMVLLTGTFTDGGTDIYFGDTLDTVYAAGGHYTSHAATGILINQPSGTPGYAAGETGAMAVDGTPSDPRVFFNVGDTAYNAAGARLGTITALGASAITIGGGLAVTVGDNAAIHKFGAAAPAVTLLNDNLDVSIDTTNKYVVVGCGNMGAASTAATGDGRWWILGQR